MNITLGLLTHRAIDFDRVELLEASVRSIERALPTARLYGLDNGSSDGTWDVLKDVTSHRWALLGAPSTEPSPPGRGRNRLVEYMGLAGDLLVLSDDDMIWHEGAEDKLTRFFAAAPDDVALVSGFVEPDFAHATPRAAVEYGGVRGVVRDNAPGCCWAFRPAFWREFGPQPETPIGEDTEVCGRVLTAGRRMVTIRLAEHLGLGRSSLGNCAGRVAPAFDAARWGV